MKTKSKDTLYCGVNKELILSAKPELDWENVYNFKEFVIERYRIHKRKDNMGLLSPWTENPVLREFKFTNVRREHDRQTKYLISNISNNGSLSLEDKIVNSFLFRAWNNWSTLRDFGFPYKAEEIYSPELKMAIRPKYERLSRQEPKRLWYNNAYNQGGTKQAWKSLNTNEEVEKDIPLRPFHVGVWLGEQHIVEKLLAAKDQQEAFKVIKSVRGFADFLAYQVYVDLTYIEDFPFSENEFVIAGPGCKRGLDLIFKDKDGMSYSECIFWLRDKINEEDYSLFMNDELYDYEKSKGYSSKNYIPYTLFKDLPEYDRCMNVMSIENCMCELSKYVKAVNGTGRPKNKYKPCKEE